MGGGVASLLLGCELAGRRPVTLITAEVPERAGGHLASWREGGYPVEHGFHALFECYRTALPLLARHGVLGGFVRAPDHFCLHDGARLRRIRNGWRSLVPPLGAAFYAGALPGLGRAGELVRAMRGDADALARLDREDFRAALRRIGCGPGLVSSSLIRMFYDFGFTGTGELSAAVALTVLARLVEGGRMLHFPGPSREVLIDPLRRRFVALGGRILDATRIDELVLDGARVAQIAGRHGAWLVDELVLAVDVEGFRALRWVGGPRPAFAAGVDRLRGLSSVSLQAWFPDDPVPPAIDQVIGGLPEPWSTLCPATRVRGRVTAPGHELIACGPEAGVEDVSDDALVDQFFAMIARLGMRVPPGRRGVHVVMRRNRAAGERYLATRPGELAYRPAPVTTLDNVCVAGAWTRVPFAMPSLEAAAQSAVVIREALARRTAALELRTAPPYPAPPYRHDGVLRMFRLRVDGDALAARIPAGLVPARGWSRHIVALVTDYVAHADPSGAQFPVTELAFAAVVAEPGRLPGLYPFTLFVDSDVALMCGRELYGFPKRLATVTLGAGALDVTRLGAPLVRARWQRDAVHWPAGPLAAAIRATRGLTLYNRPATYPGGVVQPTLTRARAHDVVLGMPIQLTAARFELGASPLDPLRDLLPAGAGALTARFGVELPLAFTLGAPEPFAPRAAPPTSSAAPPLARQRTARFAGAGSP